MLVAAVAGCAPQQFDRALTYFTDREGVRDAACRRSSAAWFLRFDAALLHDLDVAIAEASGTASREQAELTLRGAAALAGASITTEIERLSPAAQAELAARAGCEPNPDALASVALSRASEAVAREVERLQESDATEFRRRLRRIRAGVEPLPDDRDRAARQVMMLALAPPVAIGIENKERELRAAVRQRTCRVAGPVTVWTPPPAPPNGDLLRRWAPIVAIEWPAARDYPDDFDRIGCVALSGTREHIDVSIRATRPALYTYTSTALIHGRRMRQLEYVWWFSDRPAMSTNDVAAGHVDGGTLRLTLDRDDRPAIAEVILNCGCGHEVYIAEDVEQAARAEFGPPAVGAQFAVQRPADRRPILVAGAFTRGGAPSRPLVLLSAGTHEPVCVTMAAPRDVSGGIASTQTYDLLEYASLDHLPLGTGFASMFGPDGLVHFAGRREGFLLAPSGMLSAGQPRKRGTQRIRWDEYLFDDPTLLDRMLRLPRNF